ncbi:hypothetical protein JCM10908_000162 [Rhodotorula pacifica]|uniref:uncharacterized protein n=1 Tax=Rhodotorula pacifica TaxID=1495444 RepID=UPI00316E4F2B
MGEPMQEISVLEDRAPQVFAPTLTTQRERGDSMSSGSDDSVKEGPEQRQSASWADAGNVAQQPALTYHQGPSVTTIGSSDDDVSVPYVGYTAAPAVAPRKRFRAPQKSTMLDRSVGNPKPWMKGRKTITRDKKSYFTTLFGITLGLGGGLAAILHSALTVGHDKYDLVFADEFEGDTLNQSHWRVEERVGGGESNDFNWYTNHNSYVADGNLWIVPTLTNETLLDTDYALLNSTFLQLGSGCSSPHQTDCYISADVENNQTLVVPPVQSAMISTRDKVAIQYGRIVMRARMPTGDWLWPQISLVPQDDYYGAYPASGLISVFESRGNKAPHRLDQLNNEMICGLHWGPANAPSFDRFYLTQGLYKVYRNFFNQDYYDFGVDWTPTSVTMWVKTRVRIAFRYGFGSKTFWKLGEFGYSFGNGTLITNPWANAENQNIAPFDKPFYLRLAVQTGGTDGYWMDNLPNKPWRNSDARPQAMSRFFEWANIWMPTWPSGDKIRERGMAIDRVEVYQRRN